MDVVIGAGRETGWGGKARDPLHSTAEHSGAQLGRDGGVEVSTISPRSLTDESLGKRRGGRERCR